MRPLLPLILATAAAAQTLSFSPQPKSAASAALLSPEATIWAVVACVPPGTAGVGLAAGRIYQLFESKGYTHISRPLQSALVNRKESRSLPSKILRYTGYAAAGAAYLTSSGIIKASPQWQQGLTTGAGFLGVLVPLLQKDLPAPDPAATQGLLGDGLIIAPGACGESLILASRSSQEATFQISF